MKENWYYFLLIGLFCLIFAVSIATMFLGMWGWFQGTCDLAAYFGMGGGFMALLISMVKISELTEEYKIERKGES